MDVAVRDVSKSEPVTVVVTRRVKPGHEAEYERWLTLLISEAKRMPGYLGTSVQRPGPTGPREYTSIYRFESVAHLQAFEQSEVRARLLAEVGPHVEADAVGKRFTGLEFWFAAPPGTAVPQPVRWRMALVMITVVYLLVLCIGQLVSLVIGGAPAQLRLLVTIAIEVFLLTYVIMPRLTRLIARWIYPSVKPTTG
jgi:antibiotic biosynthesis monooxygenase (ABM) superfamily enzyme